MYHFIQKKPSALLNLKRQVSSFSVFLTLFFCLVWHQTVAYDEDKKMKMLELCDRLVAQCKNNELAEAEQTIAEAEALKTSPEVICYMKGVLAETQKKPEEAQEAFLAAINLRADYAAPHLKMGTFLRKQDNLEEAALHFEKAFYGHATPDEKIKAKLGTLLILEHQQLLNKEAIKHFKELHHAVPHQKYPFRLYLLEARTAFVVGEYSMAQKAAANAAEAESKNYDEAYYLHIAASHELKNYEAMGRYIDQIKSDVYKNKVKSIDYEYYYNLGYAYYHAYELDLSSHFIDISLKIKPTYLNAVQYHNLIEKKSADKTRDISHVNHKLLGANYTTHDAGYYFDLTRLYLHEKKYTKAIHTADSCFRADRQNGEVLFLKAIAQYKHHHGQDAIKTLAQLLEMPYCLDKDNRDKVLFTQANIFRHLHQPDRAREQLNAISEGLYKAAANYELAHLK